MTENRHKSDNGTAGKKVSIREMEEFQRFSLLFRLQHIGIFTSVIILIITGMPLKYPDSTYAFWFFKAVGGIVAGGIIHRVAAALLIFVGTFHIFYITAMREGRREFVSLLPKPRDFSDVFHNVLYFFGFSEEAPKFERYSYKEKFDYWAVYWGMVVMIGSGLLLWFHNWSMSAFPKVWLDVAREAHSDEALLATLAIVIWHFYNVHFHPGRFPMSWTWLTGKISREEMLEDHAAEYERIEAEEGEDR